LSATRTELWALPAPRAEIDPAQWRARQLHQPPLAPARHSGRPGHHGAPRGTTGGHWARNGPQHHETGLGLPPVTNCPSRLPQQAAAHRLPQQDAPTGCCTQAAPTGCPQQAAAPTRLLHTDCPNRMLPQQAAAHRLPQQDAAHRLPQQAAAHRMPPNRMPQQGCCTQSAPTVCPTDCCPNRLPRPLGAPRKTGSIPPVLPLEARSHEMVSLGRRGKTGSIPPYAVV
jgi:hypothetical protein